MQSPEQLAPRHAVFVRRAVRTYRPWLAVIFIIGASAFCLACLLFLCASIVVLPDATTPVVGPTPPRPVSTLGSMIRRGVRSVPWLNTHVRAREPKFAGIFTPQSHRIPSNILQIDSTGTVHSADARFADKSHDISKDLGTGRYIVLTILIDSWSKGFFYPSRNLLCLRAHLRPLRDSDGPLTDADMLAVMNAFETLPELASARAALPERTPGLDRLFAAPSEVSGVALVRRWIGHDPNAGLIGTFLNTAIAFSFLGSVGGWLAARAGIRRHRQVCRLRKGLCPSCAFPSPPLPELLSQPDIAPPAQTPPCTECGTVLRLISIGPWKERLHQPVSSLFRR